MGREVVFMKRAILILTLTMITILAALSMSFADEMRPKSIEAVLSEIRVEQGIGTSDRIDPDKVSQAKLEELGDSVMEAMIGNSEMHDRMDIRLGGDGSASLKAYHVNLGLNYLLDYPNGIVNMMGGGMMGYNRGYSNAAWDGYGNGMMRYYGHFFIAAMAISLIIIIGTILVVIYVLRRRARSSLHDESLEILNRRYANGEITKDELDRMAKIIDPSNKMKL
jgi:uncharacterized membrane protein